MVRIPIRIQVFKYHQKKINFWTDASSNENLIIWKILKIWMFSLKVQIASFAASCYKNVRSRNFRFAFHVFHPIMNLSILKKWTGISIIFWKKRLIKIKFKTLKIHSVSAFKCSIFEQKSKIQTRRKDTVHSWKRY